MHTVNISMPGYTKKKLQEYKHVADNKMQICPYSPEPKKFGTEAQATLPPNNSPCLNAKGIRHIQQIVGSILYYARAVNMTVLTALSLIAVKQTKEMEKNNVPMITGYLSGNLSAKVQFQASNMVFNIHPDALYLSDAKARSRGCGHFFHRMDAHEQGAYLYERSVSHQQNNLMWRW